VAEANLPILFEGTPQSCLLSQSDGVGVRADLHLSSQSDNVSVYANLILTHPDFCPKIEDCHLAWTTWLRDTTMYEATTMLKYTNGSETVLWVRFGES